MDGVATLRDSDSLGDKGTDNRRLPNTEPQTVEVPLSPLHDSKLIIRQSAVSYQLRWNVGMMGRRNTGSGGPRFVVAGRDGARPSSGGLLPACPP